MFNITLLPVKDEKLIRIVESLAKEIWNEHYLPIIGENQVKYMLKKFQSIEAVSSQIKEGFLYYLINRNDSYVGYFSIILRENHLFLSKIYIKYDCRGKGLGKKVFHFLENLAVENNLEEILLTVNRKNLNSIKSYKKSGFIIAESIVQDIGSGFFMDDYLMKKILIN